MYKKKFKEALKAKNMTQKDLANYLCVTPQAVSKWVNEGCLPTVDKVEIINKILNLNLVELFVINQGTYAKLYSCSNNKNMTHPKLEEIDSFEKSIEESKRLINNSGITEKYSKPVTTLLNWLIPAIIGLSYHQKLNSNPEEDNDYCNIYYNLVDYFEKGCPTCEDLYENYLEYNFYLMGMDLFESFEPYKLKNHDYCAQSMSNWYKFKKALIKSDSSPIYCELVIAINDLADYIFEVSANH